MTQFDLYDVVRAVRIPSGIRPSTLVESPPRIGDTGAVVMVFETPMDGCIVEAGGSKWLTDFRPEDLEKHKREKSALIVSELVRAVYAVHLGGNPCLTSPPS